MLSRFWSAEPVLASGDSPSSVLQAKNKEITPDENGNNYSSVWSGEHRCKLIASSFAFRQMSESVEVPDSRIRSVVDDDAQFRILTAYTERSFDRILEDHPQLQCGVSGRRFNRLRKFRMSFTSVG